VTTAYSTEILADFDKYDGKEVISRSIDGKTHHGKGFVCELKDAEGRIQIYVARDDISTDEEKTMYNVVFKTIGYWRFYWGSWNGFQNAGG
jgi:lysyl-tRNA synthetase class 2